MIGKMSTVDKTFNHLCSRLNYTHKNGLVTSLNDTESELEKQIFKQVNDKLGIDSIFFFKSETGQSIPLIYFHKLESID